MNNNKEVPMEANMRGEQGPSDQRDVGDMERKEIEEVWARRREWQRELEI